jgi:hypothetical protein
MLRKDIKQLLLIPLFDQIHEKQHFFSCFSRQIGGFIFPAQMVP